MFKKAILWTLGAMLLMGAGLNVQAMEGNALLVANASNVVVNDSEESFVTVDISDMVYQAGGWGVPESDDIDVLCAIQNMDQLEAEMLAAVKSESSQLDVRNYNIYTSDIETVEELLADIINSNPELFYVNAYVGYSYQSSGKVTTLKFYYLNYTDEQKEKYAKKISKVKSLVTNDMTDVEKALVLHDYLVQNCSYAYEEYLNGTLHTCGKSVYSAYGALVEGESVCQGYAEAYSAMLAAVGIESKVCSSDSMNHAWNLVLIDGAWYHVDATWDDPVWNTEGKTGHYYFMVSDAEFLNRKHYGWGTDICTSTKYDAADYWWTDVESQIVLEGGKQYYLQEMDRGFQLIEKAGETISAKYDNNARWEVWGSGSRFWVGAFTYLSKQGDYIYFNDKVNLYAMNLNDFVPNIIYTYNGGDGYIYGAMVYEDGYARLNISQTPSRETDDYITISLKTAAPNVVADYTAGTLSTTSAMEYSLNNGVTWTRCSDNMKINSFWWGDKDKLSIMFRTAAANGKLASDAIVVEPTAFKDVEVNSYYEVPVQWAVANGITNGYGSETTFCPENVCTRGQIVTFLWRAKGCPEPTSLANPFTDVAADAYYYKAVLWAVEQGITNGYGCDTIFNPDGECTRGQVATFMWRAEGEPAVNSATNPFIDLAEGAYYSNAVLWAVEQGITNGYGREDTFRPDLVCTRGQIVTLLYRGMN